MVNELTTFFTSDLHIGHANVIEHDSRPFSSVEEMNEELIRRWNNKVRSDDVVYCLGDMFWKGDCESIQDILKRLNGQIILIKGNHDRCILCHYPIHFYNGYYHNTIMLYGHVHDTHEHQLVKQYAKWLNENECPVHMYNVGTMLWNYEPVSLDEILEVNKT